MLVHQCFNVEEWSRKMHVTSASLSKQPNTNTIWTFYASLYAGKHMYFNMYILSFICREAYVFWLLIFIAIFSLIKYLFFAVEVFLPFLWSNPRFFVFWLCWPWHQASLCFLASSFSNWKFEFEVKAEFSLIWQIFKVFHAVFSICDQNTNTSN